MVEELKDSQDLKNRIEAVLFISGNFVSIRDIRSYLPFYKEGDIEKYTEELMQDYVKRDSAMFIEKKEFEETIENKTFITKVYKISLKEEYKYLASQLVNEKQLEGPVQETLALIAYKQPIKQSDLIKMRGVVAYEHLRDLKQMGLVSADKSGNTRILKLTKKFYDFFDINKSNMDEVLKEIEKRMKLIETKQKKLEAPKTEQPAQQQ